MPTPLLDRIRAAAIATPSLTAILGTSPFRWWSIQLGQGSALPAVVTQVVSGGPSYGVAGRFQCSSSRVQFTLWGAANTASAVATLAALEQALIAFLDTLNLIGISGLVQYPNQVVMQRDAFYAATQPGNPQKLIDAMVFSNDTL